MTTPPGWQFGWVTVSDDGSAYASSVATARIVTFVVELQEAETALASLAPAEPSPSAAAVVASPTPLSGGPEQVRVGSTFPVPFTAERPSTTIGTTRFRGWGVR